MRWIKKMFRFTSQQGHPEIREQLAEARQVRMQSEQELAITEARRATEIRLVKDPLTRTRRDMVAHNHVIDDLVRHLRERGSAPNGA